MPDAPGLELIRGEIEQSHPGAVLDTGFDHGQAALVVDPAQILAVLGWLREASGQEYRLPLQPPRRRLSAGRAPLRRPLRADQPRPGRAAAGESDARRPGGLERGDALPEIDSCVELFPTANFQEREAYDFFGIVFRGHPDLTRILLPEDYVGWPQRRDFPIGGEPVTFTYNERARRVIDAESARVRCGERASASGARDRGDDDQHRAAPPGDPRGAAAGRRPRRRGRPRAASR